MTAVNLVCPHLMLLADKGLLVIAISPFLLVDEHRACEHGQAHPDRTERRNGRVRETRMSDLRRWG